MLNQRTVAILLGSTHPIGRGLAKSRREAINAKGRPDGLLKRFFSRKEEDDT
jgi:hypothetical protein